MTYYKNLPKLPSEEVVERFREDGMTAYTYDEIVAVAEAADDANRRWAEACAKAAASALQEKNFFLMTIEERDRHGRIAALAEKHTEVSVFGAKRHSREAYPLKTAQQALRRLGKGIAAMNALALEFSRKEQ